MKRLIVTTAGVWLALATCQAQTSASGWTEAFNMRSEKLRTHYVEEPVLVSAIEAPILKGINEWASFCADLLGGQVTEVVSLGRVAASPTVDYEILKMRATTGGYAQLVVWKETGDKKQREVEVLARYGSSSAGVAAEIDEARQRWIELCNSHQPAALVSAMYTAKAMYYNHRPLEQGTESITREYAYMANPKYSLQLTPLISEVIHDRLVFEIGQCSGSYGGKYVLVWLKNEEGQWQVAFDTNI